MDTPIAQVSSASTPSSLISTQQEGKPAEGTSGHSSRTIISPVSSATNATTTSQQIYKPDELSSETTKLLTAPPPLPSSTNQILVEKALASNSQPGSPRASAAEVSFSQANQSASIEDAPSRTTNVLELDESLFAALKKHYRTPQDIQIIEDRTKELRFFQQLNKEPAHVKAHLHRRICKYLAFEFYPKGKVVFFEGDHADHFFVLLRGSAVILIKDSKQPFQTTKPTQITTSSSSSAAAAALSSQLQNQNLTSMQSVSSNINTQASLSNNNLNNASSINTPNSTSNNNINYTIGNNSNATGQIILASSTSIGSHTVLPQPNAISQVSQISATQSLANATGGKLLTQKRSFLGKLPMLSQMQSQTTSSFSVQAQQSLFRVLRLRFLHRLVWRLINIMRFLKLASAGIRSAKPKQFSFCMTSTVLGLGGIVASGQDGMATTIESLSNIPPQVTSIQAATLTAEIKKKGSKKSSQTQLLQQSEKMNNSNINNLAQVGEERYAAGQMDYYSPNNQTPSMQDSSMMLMNNNRSSSNVMSPMKFNSNNNSNTTSQQQKEAGRVLRVYGAFGWKLNAAADRLAKLRADIKKHVHADLDLMYTPNLLNFFERTTNKFKYKAMRVVSKGDSFGELALLNRKPRSATVVCLDDCYFASLSTVHYLETLKEAEKHAIAKRVQFLAAALLPRTQSPNNIDGGSNSEENSLIVAQSTSKQSQQQASQQQQQQQQQQQVFIRPYFEMKLNRIQVSFSKAKYPSGYFLQKQGQPVTKVFLLKKGEVSCRVNNPTFDVNDDCQTTSTAATSASASLSKLKSQVHLALFGKFEVIGIDELLFAMQAIDAKKELQFQQQQSQGGRYTSHTNNSRNNNYNNNNYYDDDTTNTADEFYSGVKQRHELKVVAATSIEVKSISCSVLWIPVLQFKLFLEDFAEMREFLSLKASTKQKWMHARKTQNVHIQHAAAASMNGGGAGGNLNKKKYITKSHKNKKYSNSNNSSSSSNALAKSTGFASSNELGLLPTNTTGTSFGQSVQSSNLLLMSSSSQQLQSSPNLFHSMPLILCEEAAAAADAAEKAASKDDISMHALLSKQSVLHRTFFRKYDESASQKKRNHSAADLMENFAGQPPISQEITPLMSSKKSVNSQATLEKLVSNYFQRELSHQQMINETIINSQLQHSQSTNQIISSSNTIPSSTSQLHHSASSTQYFLPASTTITAAAGQATNSTAVVPTKDCIEEGLALKYNYIHSVSSQKIKPIQIIDFIFNQKESDVQSSVAFRAAQTNTTIASVVSDLASGVIQLKKNSNQAKGISSANGSMRGTAKVDYTTLGYSDELIQRMVQKQTLLPFQEQLTSNIALASPLGATAIGNTTTTTTTSALGIFSNTNNQLNLLQDDQNNNNLQMNQLQYMQQQQQELQKYQYLNSQGIQEFEDCRKTRSMRVQAMIAQEAGAQKRKKLNICFEEIRENNRVNSKILRQSIDPNEMKSLHGPNNAIFQNLVALSTSKSTHVSPPPMFKHKPSMLRNATTASSTSTTTLNERKNNPKDLANRATTTQSQQAFKRHTQSHDSLENSVPPQSSQSAQQLQQHRQTLHSRSQSMNKLTLKGGNSMSKLKQQSYHQTPQSIAMLMNSAAAPATGTIGGERSTFGSSEEITMPPSVQEFNQMIGSPANANSFNKSSQYLNSISDSKLSLQQQYLSGNSDIRLSQFMKSDIQQTNEGVTAVGAYGQNTNSKAVLAEILGRITMQNSSRVVEMVKQTTSAILGARCSRKSLPDAVPPQQQFSTSTRIPSKPNGLLAQSASMSGFNMSASNLLPKKHQQSKEVVNIHVELSKNLLACRTPQTPPTWMNQQNNLITSGVSTATITPTQQTQSINVNKGQLLNSQLQSLLSTQQITVQKEEKRNKSSQYIQSNNNTNKSVIAGKPQKQFVVSPPVNVSLTEIKSASPQLSVQPHPQLNEISSSQSLSLTTSPPVVKYPRRIYNINEQQPQTTKVKTVTMLGITPAQIPSVSIEKSTANSSKVVSAIPTAFVSTVNSMASLGSNHSRS